jgi:tetratricopeptide (TPR) repeat protein
MRRNDREKLLAFARGGHLGRGGGHHRRGRRAHGPDGVELAQAGRLREAALVFEAMAEINPRDAGAQAALGTVYQKLGRTEDAGAYGEAIARDPKHPVALGNRGELLLRLAGGRASATWRRRWRPIRRARPRLAGARRGWRRPSPRTR